MSPAGLARWVATRTRGYAFLHHAVDDHSRYAYSEALTDNGSCYRSGDFAQVLSDNGIRHKRTRPYRPQTNGKVERFNRTPSEEQAYARPYTSEQERTNAYPDFLHTYNHHRAATPPSAAPHQPTAYPNSQDRTPRPLSQPRS